MLAFRTLKRVMIAIAGFSVILIGILMIVTPGPAIIVIPAGLSILAIEFAWARRWLAKMKEYIEKAKSRMKKTPNGATNPAAEKTPVAAQTLPALPSAESSQPPVS